MEGARWSTPRRRPAFCSRPSTAPGGRARRLFALSLALTALIAATAFTWFGVHGGINEEPMPISLVVPTIVAAFTAAVAAVTGGAFAVLAVWRGDRSGVLLLPLAAGLIALTFVVGEAIGHD